ncbi:hypothetical protein DI487_03575 [Flavobacterium sediminis]|uniref:Colanic acid biosynthesis glycosyltransferase WcaL n=1 Tax=Flavobacterium sediminis TaxID=2201181 RepID=A0A2U8QS93_9FLAO|nr:glycosyltransferase [Flavobacterium sediminis]AWM13032.1 hypothetical protein DI487_03575 [Flavobacterium sediminis]
MRIAIVVNKFPVLTETFIVNQITSLIDGGHDVTILSLTKGETENCHEAIRQYHLLDKVHYLIKEPKRKITRFTFFIKYLLKNSKRYKVSKVIKALNIFRYKTQAVSLHTFYRNQWFLGEDFDVIHAHFASVGVFVTGLRKDGFFPKSKLAVSFHGSDIIPQNIERYKQNYKLLFEKMNLITYNSEYTLAVLEKTTTIDSRFKLLPVGLDVNKFKTAETIVRKEPFEILFCGRLVNFKAPDLAVEIVNELVKKGHNIHLSIVGEGPLQKKLKDLIHNYGLEQNISLLGAISQEQIVAHLRKTAVFLLPGITEEETKRAENQGLVIQEAQAMQVPVVVSDAGGMKYGLVDNVTGFVVKEKDIHSFVKKLETLIQNEPLRMEMGKKGRAFVAEHFDSKVLYHKLLRYYNLLLDENFTH